MKTFEEIIGSAPVENADGTYWPSKASRLIAVQKKSDYDYTEYPNAYKGGDKKILVLCTEEDLLECTNGKTFKTGNHPVEIFVVLLHLERAGFTIDLATLTGRSVKIEDFAIPIDDSAVLDAIERYADQLNSPLSMLDVYNSLDENSPYEALYIPGGHGAILDLPFSEDTKSILHWFIENDKYVITICHGPAAILSLTLNEDPNKFHYKGYKVAYFSDAGDKMMTAVGYLPGPLSWHFGEKLEELGVIGVSKIPVGIVHTDRKLISGDSPMAANKLGKKAAEALLSNIQNK